MAVTIAGLKKAFELMESETTMVGDDKDLAPSKNATKCARWLQFLESVGVDDDERVQRAALAIVRSNKFFPKWSEFELVLLGNIDNRIELAWQGVRENMRRLGASSSWFIDDLGGDGCALWCVSRMGLETLGQMTDHDRGFHRAEFAKLYRAAAEKGLSETHLPGQIERANHFSGHALSSPAHFGRGELPASQLKALEAPNVKGNGATIALVGQGKAGPKGKNSELTTLKGQSALAKLKARVVENYPNVAGGLDRTGS